MRILLAGANGFLGGHLAHAFTFAGHEVVGLIRGSPRHAHCRTFVSAATSELRTLPIENLRADVIVNAAAAGVNPGTRDPELLVDSNVALPVALVELATRIAAKAIVHFGSSAEYAETRPGRYLSEDSPLEHGRLYGATKAAGTLAILASADHHRLPATVLRPFNLFGPYEAPYRLFAFLVERLSRGKEVPLSPGTQIRDFISVREACRATMGVLKAIEHDKDVGGIYNLTCGRPMSVADFAMNVARAMDADLGLLKFGALPMRADDLAWVVGSPHRLAEAIDWRCEDLGTELDACIQLEISRLRASQ
jgi:nucleoside-diphosphate-sugar epimerase